MKSPKTESGFAILGVIIGITMLGIGIALMHNSDGEVSKPGCEEVRDGCIRSCGADTVCQYGCESSFTTCKKQEPSLGAGSSSHPMIIKEK